MRLRLQRGLCSPSGLLDIWEGYHDAGVEVYNLLARCVWVVHPASNAGEEEVPTLPPKWQSLETFIVMRTGKRLFLFYNSYKLLPEDLPYILLMNSE